MLITNHVLTGAAIGAVAPNNTSAAAAGIVSHAVLDVLPHFLIPHRYFLTLAVCDGLVGLAVSGAILAASRPERRVRIAAGIFGACLPDLDKPGRELFGRSPFPGRVDRLHARIQTERPGLAPLEALTAAGLGTLVWRLVTPRQRRAAMPVLAAVPTSRRVAV